MGKYNYLNLNQKMIKIRKKIPALIRRRYSEEVDYDFVKLDDINQFLAPALNRYGVDFDILRELPTQTDASGNAVFLTAEGNLWRYEADLEVCWTNADHPEEKITAFVHLVGTHDVADKAKGTAMTYGLKYYLLNKFNIPQNGDEDPDMRGKKTTGETQKTAPGKKEKKEKTDAVGSKRTEQNGFVPQGSLDEGLGELPRRTDSEGTGMKASRSGNAVSSGKTEDIDFSAEEEPEAEDTAGGDIQDDFRSVEDGEEIPFSDDEEEAQADSAQPEEGDDRLEKARAVVCNFGYFQGHTLGEMLETQKGWESLKWIAVRYNGANKEMKNAAKILVEADAYMQNAA